LTYVDLASRALGGAVLAANDESFCAAGHLIDPRPPSFSPKTFDHNGQIYDGWETRRRREPGYDWVIVRLGAPGIVREVVVDTAFFKGNYPPHCSLSAARIQGYPSVEELSEVVWTPLVELSALKGDTANTFAVTDEATYTHVRLAIHPDGGVARLRVHGEPVPDPRLLPGGVLDLAAAEHGGVVVGCSDMFYGSPGNLLLPGLARVMGEGWETARRRDDGNDWVHVRLATPGEILLAELDTTHFKGNAPDSAALRGLGPDGDWFEVLPRTRLAPDTRHRFPVRAGAVAAEVRLDVYPDGGMARLRLWGRLRPQDRDGLVLRWFNALPPVQAHAVLTGPGGLPGPAADSLIAGRPLTDVAPLPPPLS
jgi:allantoicase